MKFNIPFDPGEIEICGTALYKFVEKLEPIDNSKDRVDARHLAMGKATAIV
jgi:hypothetical protein